MARASTLDLHDRACGGKLVPLLRDMRQRGEPYEAVARAVHDLGVTVSTTTVYRWCRTLTDQPTEAAS